MLDRQLHPRLAIKTRDKEGGHIVYRIAGAELEPLMVIEHEDDLTTHPIGFTQDGTHALLDLLGRPRQGRAARQGLADRARSGCSPSTPRPTSAAYGEPEDARGRGGRRRST